MRVKSKVNQFKSEAGKVINYEQLYVTSSINGQDYDINLKIDNSFAKRMIAQSLDTAELCIEIGTYEKDGQKKKYESPIITFMYRGAEEKVYVKLTNIEKYLVKINDYLPFE